MLGWFLGKRYRSIRDALVPFLKDQGRGDLAARLIEIVPDFKKAKSVFNDCRYDSNPRGLDLLYAAMVVCLRNEGVCPETRLFLEKEEIKDIDDTEVEQYEIERQYEWMVAEFEEKCTKDQTFQK